MPLLAVPSAITTPMLGIYRILGENDEAISSQGYSEPARMALQEFFRSVSLRSKAGFADARRRLEATADLGYGWDSYGAEPPNALARTVAASVLASLEEAFLLPLQVTPSVEGGIAISFVESGNRAVVETYNTGEIAVATYSDEGEPEVWEVQSRGEASFQEMINQIRVHLAA